MKYLLLTLGHNSSAILIEDNKIVWGYETERITGIKSDSRFPMPFIAAYLEEQGGHVPVPDMVYVTHWAPDGQLSSMSAKHWDPAYFDGIPIRTLSTDRSHHDTHMAAAVCYAGDKFPIDKTYGLVVDGFGTYGEHFSVYKITKSGQQLVRRIHGYETSLGLWYQYATAFMGMKMHEDEYKLLGYEVHVTDEDAKSLNVDATIAAMEWLELMKKSVYGSKFDPMYNLSALAAIKDSVFSRLTKICKDYNIHSPHTTEARTILAYYVQKVLENVVLTFIADLNPRHIILSGGCFYNVKLNKLIIDAVGGQTCIYPLAGDQGNALGLYYMDHPSFVMPDNFNWGTRILREMGDVPNMHVVDELEALTLVQKYLNMYGFVNLVRGSMEFGPRAMCNTSTLAMPDESSVHRINMANDRNTVMPMAPVMNMQMYKQLFDRWDHVWKSYAHMITALEYTEHPKAEMLGVSHEYWQPHHCHTGRPQVVSARDDFMQNLLARVGHPLINTSFNFHGMPIALGMSSIIANHMMQYQRDKSFNTVVIKNV